MAFIHHTGVQDTNKTTPMAAGITTPTMPAATILILVVAVAILIIAVASLVFMLRFVSARVEDLIATETVLVRCNHAAQARADRETAERELVDQQLASCEAQMQELRSRLVCNFRATVASLSDAL
jgi:hypothetical protein